MSKEKVENKEIVSPFKGFCPFISRINAPAKKDFDKYYIDRQVITVFKSSGQKDENGNDLGVAVKKVVDKKVDIRELLESQRDTVGVEAYMKALVLQGENINDYNTQVDKESVQDFSQCPDTLAEVMTAGDKARKAFENMDPALKGNHTTIEGFLNSLSSDTIDNYIKGRIEALTPKKESE